MKLIILRNNLISQSLIAILCALMIHCNSKKELTEKKNIQEEHPRYSSITFTEDLRIDRQNWYPGCLEIDEEGKIYVFEVDYAKIYIYDKDGNELGQKEFKQGQGLGDINFMDPTFSSDSNLYIFDKKIQRLTIFNKQWKILDTRELRKELGKNFLFFWLDSRNYMYFWTYKTNFIEGKYSPSRILIKLSPTGKFLGEIFEYRDIGAEYESQHRHENIVPIYLYPPFGTFKVDAKDFVYYAVSDKYEINIISPQGEFVRKIIKATKPRKVTEKDTAEHISGFKKALSRFGGVKFFIPDRMPAIADFFVFDNKYILVVTFENPIDSPTLSGDLFDNDGNFLSEVDVPKYHRYGDWNGLFKKCAINKKNYFYTIEYKDEDNRIVKRYRMTWN